MPWSHLSHWESSTLDWPSHGTKLRRAPSSCSMSCWVCFLAYGLFLHLGLILDLHSLWGRTQPQLPCPGEGGRKQILEQTAPWQRKAPLWWFLHIYPDGHVLKPHDWGKRHKQWDSESFGLIVVLWQRSNLTRQSSRAFLTPFSSLGGCGWKILLQNTLSLEHPRLCSRVRPWA